MKFEPKLHRLSNGIPVILDPMDIETTIVKIIFKTGGRDEKPEDQGITHFCEHMLCKGTPRFPNQRLAEEFLDYNAGYKNAYTSMAEVGFGGRILGENVNVLLDVLCDQLQNSLFAEDKIEIERNVIADEIRRALDNQDKQFLVFRDKVLFGLDFQNGSPVLGSFENVSKFSRQQMLDFIAKRFSAKNCVVGISGKITNPDLILSNLETNLSFLPNIDVSENKELKYTPSIVHDLKTDKKDVKLRIYFPRLYDSSLETRYKRFSAGKLFRFIREELFNIIRHENGIAYGFACSHVGNETLTLDSYATKTSPENIKRVVELIAQNAFRLYNAKPVTTEVLDRFTKSDRLGDADFLESAVQRCNKLIDFFCMYEKLYDYDEVNKMHKMITPQDVFDYSRGMYDGQMSIITQGANIDVDLKQTWIDNFK